MAEIKLLGLFWLRNKKGKLEGECISGDKIVPWVGITKKVMMMGAFAMIKEMEANSFKLKVFLIRMAMMVRLEDKSIGNSNFRFITQTYSKSMFIWIRVHMN